MPASALGPALTDRVGRRRRCPPVLLGQQVQAGGGGEQLQRLPQPVELELADHPVPGPGRAARVPAQPERALVRDGLAADRVGGHQIRAVGEDPFGEEPDGPLEQGMRTVRGDRQARVALVADPRVPVVVVPPAFQALRQRGGRGGDHRTAARGQPSQDGVGMAGVPDRDQVRAVGHHGGPGLLGRRPGVVRIGRRAVQRPVGQFQDQVVVAPGGQRQGQRKAVRGAPGPGGARPPEPDRAAAAGPPPVAAGQIGHLAAPEPGADVQQHVHPGRAVDRFDPPQDDDPVRVGRKGQRLPALGVRGIAGPPAPPDEAAGLVVPAPDVPRIRRGDRVPARAAEQPAEDGRAVPPWCAQPADRAVRADQGTTLTIRDQGILAQDVRPERSRHAGAPVPRIVGRNTTAAPAGLAVPGSRPVRLAEERPA